MHLNCMFKMRKIYYVPGMITALGLLFMIPHFYNKIIPPVQVLLSVNEPRDEGFEQSYTILSVLKFIRNKKKLNITLDGDRKKNAKKIELIRYETRKLLYTADKTNIILITFTKDMVYEDFVVAYNVCIAEKVVLFSVWPDHLAIFGNPPRKREPPKNDIQLIEL